MSKVIIITGDQATGKTVLARKIADAIGKNDHWCFSEYRLKSNRIKKIVLERFVESDNTCAAMILDEVDNSILTKVVDELHECMNGSIMPLIPIITCQNAILPKSYQDKTTIIDLNYYKQCQPHN